MTDFSRRWNELPPAAIDLGAVIYAQTINGGDADAAFETGQALGPAVVIGRAAMTLTGNPDIRTATEELLTNTALQQEVLASLTVLEEQGVSQIPEVIQSRRVAQLRDVASANAVDVNQLYRGETVTVVYEPRRRRLGNAVLEIARTHAGSDNNKLAVIIRAMQGERLHPRWSLGVGRTMYLGYQHDGNDHTSVLMRDAPPAWVRRVVSKKGEDGSKSWKYDKLYRDRRFALAQVYYGKTDHYPLFS